MFSEFWQCGHTAPFGQRTSSTYWRAASSVEKRAWISSSVKSAGVGSIDFFFMRPEYRLNDICQMYNPQALAIRPEIREVKRGRKKSVRQPPDQFGLWLSLVERLVRDQEAVGSNPTSPIIFIRHRFSWKFRNLRESDQFQIHPYDSAIGNAGP